MEAWKLEGSLGGPRRPVVKDSHQLNEEQDSDPHKSEKLDPEPEPHLGEELDLDPHLSDADLQPLFYLHRNYLRTANELIDTELYYLKVIWKTLRLLN